jgi:hypothetical protein
MKHSSWIVIATVFVLVVGVWSALHMRKADHTPPATTTALARAHTTPRTLTAQTSMSHRMSDSTGLARKPKDDLKDKLKNAKDYFALAKSILAQARNGDA